MAKPWSTKFRYFMLGMMLIGFIGLLWYAKVVVTPIIISALLAYVLHPVVGWVDRITPINRRWVINITFLIGIAFLIAIPAIFLPVLVDEIQILLIDIDEILLNVQEFLSAPIIIYQWSFGLEQFLPDFAQTFSESITGITVDAFHLVESVTRNLLWVVVIFISTYSLLCEWDRLREWLFRLAPVEYQDDVRHLYKEVRKIWGGYLRGNIALMTVSGIMLTIAWFILGVPGALILGVIGGLLEIIPDLGPAIASLLVLILALVEGSSWIPISNFWFTVLVGGVYLLQINIKNIFIRPRIFGRSVQMNPAIVFIAIIGALIIEGVLGALIVIPVLASGGIISRYIWNQILGIPPFPVPESDNLVENKLAVKTGDDNVSESD